MAQYRVIYRTPVVDRGEAHVAAAGIHAAQDEARSVVRILTGHSPDTILILAVAAPDGPTLWWDPALYTPTSKELSHVGSR